MRLSFFVSNTVLEQQQQQQKQTSSPLTIHTTQLFHQTDKTQTTYHYHRYHEPASIARYGTGTPDRGHRTARHPGTHSCNRPRWPPWTFRVGSPSAPQCCWDAGRASRRLRAPSLGVAKGGRELSVGGGRFVTFGNVLIMCREWYEIFMIISAVKLYDDDNNKKI